jgi:gamma-glutamylcyclotransferase (GGCT)/AIG2-like uncharacterized protein YtfP
MRLKQALAANGAIMVEKLFVYGTLGPGRQNEHILEAIGGRWEHATVRGKLRQEGWGTEMGYPGIDLGENGEEIEGFLLGLSGIPNTILINNFIYMNKLSRKSTRARMGPC